MSEEQRRRKTHSLSIYYILGTAMYHLSNLQQFSEGGTDVIRCGK